MSEILKGIGFFVKSTGWKNLLRVPWLTLQRDWANRPYRKAEAARRRAPIIAPGRLLSQQAHPNGASFHFENADLLVEFLAAGLLRVSWTPGAPPPPYAQAKTDWPPLQTQLSQAFEGWRVSSTAVQALVSQEGGLQFISAGGSLLFHQLPPARQGQAWTQRARLHPEECIYGLGEQSGPFNLRGVARRIWNTDPGGSYGPEADPLYMPLPVYFGLHRDGSYLIFYENSFPALAAFAGAQVSEAPDAAISFAGGMLRYYFIAGSPEEILKSFTDLTGRSEMPPRWSLGYHQSRWGYQNEADIRQVVQGFQDHDLPLDAIHLDIDYMRGYRVFTIDEQRFPDLKGLAQELQAQGVRLVTIIDPGVKQDPQYPLYRQGMQQGMFCKLPDGKAATGIVWPGRSVYPDFTDPKARVWWGDQYPALLEAGVAGFWHDMNEPTSFTASGGKDLPLGAQHSLEGQGGDHLQGHNLYALQMNRAAHEALHRLRPEQRPWIVSRSGWVSQQRYAWNWTADTASTWEALRMTVATALGLGLSGIPYTGPDIGGFSGNPTPELYLRWFQLAAFMPFFRTHSAIGAARREPWAYGEPYTAIIRRYMLLRRSLLPYLYTLAWQTSQTGFPLLRPLFWADPADQALWAVDDAFFLGDRLLVAPALAADQDQRELRLPAGRWYSFWDDKTFQGLITVELPVTLEHIPLLVRAGSLLPLCEGENLALHIYAPDGKEAQSPQQQLYSDAGDGYGALRLDQFQVSRQNGLIQLDWQSQGEYPFPYAAVDLYLHGFQTQQVRIHAPAINAPINVQTFERWNV